MKIQRFNENKGLKYSEFTDILSNTPEYYPVFVLLDDYIWSPSVNKEAKIISKGTELYSYDPFYQGISLKTIDSRNIELEFDELFLLDFVEYRTKKEVDKELKIYRDASKYNL